MPLADDSSAAAPLGCCAPTAVRDRPEYPIAHGT